MLKEWQKDGMTEQGNIIYPDHFMVGAEKRVKKIGGKKYFFRIFKVQK